MRGWRAASFLTASTVYVALVVTAAGKLGANYEEVVSYVLTSLDVRDDRQAAAPDGAAPRFVTSGHLPRLAFEPVSGLRLPLLTQLYMTNHVTYGGVALAAATGIDRLWAARLWHAAFGLVLLWLLHDVALLLGLGPRAALIAVGIAATSLPVTFMYTWARFDESLASLGTVAVLCAALRHGRDRRRRWIWVGVVAVATAVSGKVTALWPLAALAIAAGRAGWRPPHARDLVLPALVAAPLFLPMVGFAVAGPATGHEVGRRLAFLGDLFTGEVILGTAANLIDYLGNWGGILSKIIRGTDMRAANVVGLLLVSGTLLWLIVRTLVPGPVPRRYRLETQMLTVVGVVFVLVALFFREHRDYQFALLVPLHALGLAAFVEWCAKRLLDDRVRPWLAGVLVCALPVASNLWDQYHLHDDLRSARNAMLDLGAQRESAAWLAEHGVHHPIVVTFYAVGTYELFTDGMVRPIYAFPLLRHPNEGPERPDYAAVWRALLSDAEKQPRFVVLPLGENPVERRHFDEPVIRDALLEVATGARVADFSNQGGYPLLEVWQVKLRSPDATAGRYSGGSTLADSPRFDRVDRRQPRACL